MMVFFNHWAQGKFKQNMGQVQAVIDERIDEITSSSEELTRMHFSSDEDNLSIDELQNLIAAMNTSSGVNGFYFYFYDKGEELLYLSTDSKPIEEFGRLNNPFSNWDRDEFVDILENTTNVYVKSKQIISTSDIKNASVIPVIIPFEFKGKMTDGVGIFLMHEEYFLDIFKGAFSDLQALTIIKDEKDDIILSYSNLDDSHNNELLIDKSFKLTGMNNICRLDGKEYFVVSEKLYQFSGEVITMIPRGFVIWGLMDFLVIILISISIVAVMTMIAIYFVAKWHYQPLRELINYVEEELQKSYTYGNEILFIRDGFDEIIETGKKLRYLQLNSRMYMVDSLFSRLIKGDYKKIQDFTDEASEIGIEISNSNFFTAIVNFEAWGVLPSEELLDMFVSKSSVELEIFGEKGLEKNKLVLICAAREDNKDQIHYTMHKMVNDLLQNIDGAFYIGIGNTYSDTSMIHQSYMEAELALEYSIIKNKNVTFLEEINAMCDHSISYPSKQVNQFEHALFQGDLNKSYEGMNLFKDFITNDKSPAFLIQSIKYDILRIVRRQSQSINVALDTSLSIHDIKNSREFCNRICDYIKIICEYKSSNNTSENEKKLKAFQKYLDDNYSDINFSLQNMADEFGMSVSNLSHFFRKYAPENISTYVQRKRIEKAKGLLIENNLSIKEIANEVGYFNRTSFMKRFKSMTGMTAGEYREMARKSA